jgi:hypothetical protein
VLILLHNDPDPDALASGLALRNLLRRTKTTAIIGAMQGVTRPENLRMANMLDIQVEPITPASFAEFDRIATVDVQPHYFGGQLDRADLVIDHHPEQPGYSAVFKDIRADYGSTSTILTEHLRAVDVNISERTATAMLYAIKSDTLFFAARRPRGPRGVHVPLPAGRRGADPQDGGGGNHDGAADYVTRASQGGACASRSSAPSSARRPRGLHPLHGRLLPPARGREVDDHRRDRQRRADHQRAEPRLLAQRRRVREAKWFADIGSAGGHRAMAKAVVPIDAFREKFGDLDGPRR